MKTWKKYLFIYIPIGIFCCIINFCVKKDNKTPRTKFYLFNDLEKEYYSVNDCFSGKELGTIFFYIDNDNLFFDIDSKETSGTFLIGNYKNYYNFSDIKIDNIKIEKKKCKNLEFYSGKVGDWHTAVVMSLDNNDYHDYYKSDNRKRYLFCLLKNGHYNFSINDSSVYNLYVSFGVDPDMKYAAILE